MNKKSGFINEIWKKMEIQKKNGKFEENGKIRKKWKK